MLIVPNFTTMGYIVFVSVTSTKVDGYVFAQLNIKPTWREQHEKW